MSGGARRSVFGKARGSGSSLAMMMVYRRGKLVMISLVKVLHNVATVLGLERPA